MAGNDDIEALISVMARLPGLGPRSARRAVLHMIRKRAMVLAPMAELATKVAANARECVNCGNIGTADLCDLCADDGRGNGQICVVEDVADLWAMERAEAFCGRYHVLGGVLSALEGVGPEDLGIPRLLSRLQSENVQEVILALNATVDGQTTAHYLMDTLSPHARITTLAQGIPVGGELDYLDDGTLLTAMSARKPLTP